MKWFDSNSLLIKKKAPEIGAFLCKSFHAFPIKRFGKMIPTFSLKSIFPFEEDIVGIDRTKLVEKLGMLVDVTLSSFEFPLQFEEYFLDESIHSSRQTYKPSAIESTKLLPAFEILSLKISFWCIS